MNKMKLYLLQEPWLQPKGDVEWDDSSFLSCPELSSPWGERWLPDQSRSQPWHLNVVF